VIFDQVSPGNTFSFAAFFLRGDITGSLLVSALQSLVGLQGGRDVTVAQLLREVNLPPWGFSTNMVDLGYIQYPVPNNLLLGSIKMNFMDDDQGIVAKYLWSWAQEITPSAILGGTGDATVEATRSNNPRGSTYFVPYDFRSKGQLLAASGSPVRTLVVVKYAPSTAQYLAALAADDADAAIGGTGIGGIISDVMTRVGIQGIPTEIHIFPRVVPTSIVPPKLDKSVSQFREFSVELMRVPRLTETGTLESKIVAAAEALSISATVSALQTWGQAEAATEAVLATINAVVNAKSGINSVFAAMKKT
jgi:hypothetical protein